MEKILVKIRKFLETIRLLPRNKIVLAVGEYGVLLYVVHNNVITMRRFVDFADSFTDQVGSVFANHSNIPVYIFLDNAEQKFKLDEMPVMNPINSHQLINLRLEKTLSEYPVKRALYLNKSANDKVQYIFAGTMITKNIQRLIDYANTLPNPIEGSALLSCEYSKLSKNLHWEFIERQSNQEENEKDIENEDDKEDKKENDEESEVEDEKENDEESEVEDEKENDEESEVEDKKENDEASKLKNKKEKDRQESQDKWHIILTENKISGFRQVVLRNHKTILTRLIEQDHTKENIILASNLHKELSNTKLYLERLGYDQENHLLAICVIVSQGLKESFATIKSDITNLNVITPFECAKALNISHIAKPENKFIDVILSYFTLQCSLFTKFVLPNTFNLKLLYRLGVLSNYATIILFISLVYYASIHAITLPTERQKNVQLEIALKDAQNSLSELKGSVNGHNYDYYSILEINAIYDRLFSYFDSEQPINKVLIALKSISHIVEVENFIWSARASNAKNNRSSSNNLIVNTELQNVSGKYSDLFAKYQSLRSKLDNAFTGYNIEVSELPENIGSDANLSSVSIRIKVGEKE